MYQHSVKSDEPEPMGGWMHSTLSFERGDLNIFTRSVGHRVPLSPQYSNYGYNLRQQLNSR